MVERTFTLKATDGTEVFVYAWLPDGEVRATLYASHERGFAITVHKSQGSEYEQVLLLLPPTGGRRLLTKELLYTAITRAKKLVVLASTQDAFRAAVSRRIVRESGMT